MGKATEVRDYLRTQPLTAAEIVERDAAIAAGGDGEATLRGTVVKRRTPTEVPREVVRAPQQTWD